MDKGSDDSQEVALATGFDSVVRGVFTSGFVDPLVLAGGCATVLVAYLAQLPPKNRVLIVNDMVETMLSGFVDNVDADIAFAN